MPEPESVFDWIDDHAAARTEAGLTRRLVVRSPDPGTVELASDDYLGLARDKRVTSATAAAALKWGAGSTGSRLITGSTELHAELERELAAYAGTEAALVFSGGLAASLGAVTALSGKECAIVADRHLHSALVDACRQSGAALAVSGHADVPAVTHALSTRKLSRALVLTESVFAMDGDLAPLAELHTACRAHGAALLVDLSHGFGVLGDGGLANAGLANAPDVVATVSLSTALGSQGGAVLGPRRVITHLINTARSFIGDTALAPPSAGAALAALKIARDEPERAERASENAANLAEGLRAAGIPTEPPAAAIVSVPAPSARAAHEWATQLRERGVSVGCFGQPSGSDGTPRLRLSAHSGLSETDIALAVRALTETAPQH